MTTWTPGAGPDAITSAVLLTWPGPVDRAALDGLGDLPPQEALRFAQQVLAALPAGPLGATEATRLRTLATILRALPVRAGAAALAALRERYRQRGRLPRSVEDALDLVDRVSPAGTGLDPDPGYHVVEGPTRDIPSGGTCTPGLLGDDPAPSLPYPSVAPPSPSPYPSVAPPPAAQYPGPDPSDSEPLNPPATATPPSQSGAPPPSPGASPPQAEGGATAAAPENPPPGRLFRAALEDHDPGEPLQVGEPYTVAFDVGDSASAVLAAASFPDQALAAADASVTVFDLTVQLGSDDFELLGDATRPLRVPRSGPSRGKARFDVSPRHAGPCRLSATIHYQGNFLTQMELTVPVGGAAGAAVEVSTLGRPVDSAAGLEPRDISLILAPAPGSGFTCTALGSVGQQTVLPITADELDLAVEAARQALLGVVKSVHEGQLVFQAGLDIPAGAQEDALRTLARAGSRLFQRLFLHPEAGADARAVGEWLREYATDPALQLTVQVFATHAPLPWALLYLGDTAEGATLDWNLFLGMRNIIEQLPLRRLDGTRDSAITSKPALSVSVNINPTIDASMGIQLVAGHSGWWADTAATRTGLTLVPHSTALEVVRSLGSSGGDDQVVYFYCHATAAGPNGDPDGASITMGTRQDAVTLADLNLDAPTTIPLPGRPLVFINACESAELSPRFYNGFVPYFMAKGARGVIGTECNTPALFAIDWAGAFFEKFLDGLPLGETVLQLRQQFLREHGNPLGLLYAVHCDADTRIAPALERVPRPTG